MIIAYYLSAPTQQEMDSYLASLGFELEGNPTQTLESCTISVIGTPISLDENGDPIDPSSADYHANIWTYDQIELLDSITRHDPETPWRVLG